jgi:hypothetical protein
MEGNVVFAYDPSEDAVLGENLRRYMGAVISCGNFHQGQTYQLYMDGTVSGDHVNGVYDTSTITAYDGGIRHAYTGTDVAMRPGGFGGGMGQRPPEPPEGETMPEDWGQRHERPEGETRPEGQRHEHPEGETRPQPPEGQMPPDGFGGGHFPGGNADPDAQPNTMFYMQDKVNCFSGITAAE